MVKIETGCWTSLEGLSHGHKLAITAAYSIAKDRHRECGGALVHFDEWFIDNDATVIEWYQDDAGRTTSSIVFHDEECEGLEIRATDIFAALPQLLGVAR